jgi:hypothetical protein
MDAITDLPTPFILCIGGRGVGKTYGELQVMLQRGYTFLYLRRTTDEMKLVSKPEFCPIVQVARDMGRVLTCDSLSTYVSGVTEAHEDEQTRIAFIMSLTGVAHARSFDGSSITHIVYDEACPEEHLKTIRKEDLCFLNMYESIDRNRQLQGKAPVKCIVLANANNLEAPIFKALNCIKTLDDMRKKSQSVRVDEKRGLSIVLLNDSPISTIKSGTALYKLSRGVDNDFASMALDNQFGKDNYTDIAQKPLAEYIPIACIGSICLYRHKSAYVYYVCEHISGKPKKYENTIIDRVRFRKDNFAAWEAYFAKRLVFENVNAKLFFRAVMNETL